jgi:hypothetical protein
MGSAGRLLSSLIRLRKYVGDRRRAPRRGARFSARLPISVTPLGDAEDYAAGSRPFLVGSTRDLSARGLTLLLPAIRVGGRYLTDADGHLGLTIETPSGPLSILAAPARFEQLATAEGGYVCLLGVRILKMSDGERATYLSYLKSLAPRERRAEEIGRVTPDADTWTDVVPSSVAEAFEKFLRGNAHI